MKIAFLLAAMTVPLALTACGSDRVVVVQPASAMDHVVVEHAD